MRLCQISSTSSLNTTLESRDENINNLTYLTLSDELCAPLGDLPAIFLLFSSQTQLKI